MRPKALAQFGKLRLDALHDIGQGQLGWDRREHVDMIARQNAFHDMDTRFVASLDDDVTDPLAHCALQNLVPLLRSPHDVVDVVSVIKSRGRG